MTIAYNHLNLPRLFTWTGGSFQGNTVEILYDAAGTKLRKTVKIGANVSYYQDYIGGIEYRDGAREAIYTAEGRVFYTSPTTTRYEYSIRDHLGNTRLTFTDKDGDNSVEVFNTTANEVLQENHYYPFGLNMEGKWMNDAALDNKYQYNGKEWNDDFALNLNDYGARWYDAARAVWSSVDPMGGMYSSWSSYNYVKNNPLKYIDPTGMMSEAYSFAFTDWDAMQERHAEASRSYYEQKNAEAVQEKIDMAEENDGHFDFVPIFEVKESENPEVYTHTFLAQMSGHPSVLSYDSNKDRQKKRRTEATKGFPTSSLLDNDEYPYASTFEGGKGASIMPIIRSRNRSHGAKLVDFYNKRLKPGDYFIVRPVPDKDKIPSPILIPSPGGVPKKMPEGGQFPSLAPILIRSGSIVPFIIFLDPQYFSQPSNPTA